MGGRRGYKKARGGSKLVLVMGEKCKLEGKQEWELEEVELQGVKIGKESISSERGEGYPTEEPLAPNLREGIGMAIKNANCRDSGNLGRINIRKGADETLERKVPDNGR